MTRAVSANVAGKEVLCLIVSQVYPQSRDFSPIHFIIATLHSFLQPLQTFLSSTWNYSFRYVMSHASTSKGKYSLELSCIPSPTTNYTQRHCSTCRPQTTCNPRTLRILSVNIFIFCLAYRILERLSRLSSAKFVCNGQCIDVGAVYSTFYELWLSFEEITKSNSV